MLLQASGISKNYGVTNILSNINLLVNERERIGLVGVNGAGKSTLLKIIAGEIRADQGQIFKAKETRIGYLAQNSGLQSERSIWDEMLHVFAHLIETEKELRSLEEQIADPALMADEKKYADTLNRYSTRSDWFREQGGYEMETRIRSILHGMGFGSFSFDTPIRTLSGGQKTRLALARILLQAPDVLMLDEPTNYLDIETLTWLEDYLRGYSGAIVVVSHDRYFLDALVTTIVEIERHQSKRFTGNYSKYIELKAADYEIQSKHYERQQNEIAKMEDFIQKNIVRATTTKRAQSRRKALEKIERLDKPLGDLKKASFTFEVEQTTGKEVLQVNDLSMSYPNKGSLFQHVSLDMRRGETVALIGPNGIGKSTLLKALVGQLEPTNGSIFWGTNVKIGYYDQEQTGLNPNNTVLEELWSNYSHLEEARIRTVLGNFLFSGEDVLKKVMALSGGEKARVSLAKLMLKKANVLILDEPTNHLDLFSKEVLESALMDYDGTLLFISHDRYFLNKMAERIVELSPTGTQHFLGNYDDYVEKKQELAEMQAEALLIASKDSAANTATDKTTSASSFEDNKQAKREERSRQRRQEQLEAEIAQLEEEITELEHQLTLPEVYQDYVVVQETQAKIDEKKARLTLTYEHWEETMA
ncbi:multidrug ABC transporter ATP-binding protein [Paenibacillus selenitireducens]|uniref:Multidrug ABC transporter ATP-binding protein n=1 Tax=Paenibacillus selenitireducens TaxID=1324314 RepID=A0A1T2X3C9_9BACL|nr:ABC-F family ATP-binding cassette domain-containing protein [Paenibacillus selenitireducens]OPA74083.1 multidrug ABC transporter ATP-binding protein [Paenibacillus selenitireducens]